MQSKSVLVVGGSRGIGASVVSRCLAAGANVTVVSRQIGELAGVPGVRHIAADVTADSLKLADLPEVLDGFVYCPGSITLAMLRSVEPQTMRSDFELNVVGGLRCFQAALPSLKRSAAASAVFFSTVAVARGLPMHTSVAASKGAIESLVRTWACELAPGIRVNGIAPALTDTALAERFLNSEAKREAMAAKYPLGRVGTADDISAAVLFLLSADSSWMTGQILGIDGGMSNLLKA